MPRTAHHSRRSRTSCSVIALATVLAVGATPAAAQSFLGTGTYVTNPNATGITTGAGTTTINLNGGQTVIDWVPTDNAINPGVAINFQNAGTTATFTSSSDFSVLNRITPADMSRAISMNGTINARVGGVQRGNVYFYSPNGFVFGGSSVFSVGSLVVTTSPLQLTNGDFINNNSVVFGQAPNPNAAIVSNGTIDANFVPFGVGGGGSSYVAMVAPRVVHNGTITVNGSAAMVGAEAATINFSPDGLFDIQVTVGTTDANGVEVHGDIGGIAPGGVNDQHRVYLVAVPKNDALTMVIGNGADLGFTLANNASIDQYGAVVLSAGHDIVDGSIADRSAGHGADAAANFWFTGAHATNNLYGEATGYADLYSVGPTQLVTTFDSNVWVHANDHVWMAAGPGTTLTVAGDLTLSTSRSADIGGGSATGGDTRLYALDGGTVTIGGNASLYADGSGSGGDFGVAGGNGTGGQVLVQAAGGDVNIGGDLYASASGWGGSGWGASGGHGTGGLVDIWTNAGGSLTIGNGDNIGALTAYARGQGGSGDSGFTSGNGTGGQINIQALADGTVSVTTGIWADAGGRGGFGSFDSTGGIGQGGLITVRASGQNALLDVGGDSYLFAEGEGGYGGDGFGGDIFVTVDGTEAMLDFAGLLSAAADGYGGFGFDTDGGDGTGGSIELLTTGATAQLNVLGNVSLHAAGLGGNSFSEGTPVGDGGDGFGGRVAATAEDGAIHIGGDLVMDATATGGSGANGGNAIAITTPPGNEGQRGAAFLWAGATTAELRVDGVTDIDVSATGGNGSAGTGGNAQGGEIDIVSRHGDVVLGTVFGTAEGHGGDGGLGGAGGNGAGGAIDVNWSINQDTGLSGSISLGTVGLSVNGYGGDGGDGSDGNAGGNGGAGGAGTGGSVSYVGSAGGGTLTVGATAITANGIGGNGGAGGIGDSGTGGNGGAGGAGFGGFIQTGTISNDLSPTSGGTATFTSLTASANASGGAGGDGGTGGGGTGLGGHGGNATAGEANFLVRGIAVTAGVVNLFANATGGNGGSGSTAGNGGNAAAGFVSAESKDRFGHPTERGSLTATAINGTAIAQGGTGASAGTSTVRGGSFFRVLNGDANIGSVNFQFAGNLYDGTAGPNTSQAQDGSATVGSLSYSTTGELAIYTTGTGSLDVGNLTLAAGNFVDHPTLVGPANPGTIFATSLSVTSGGNFIADANLDVANGIDITVPGSIRFDNALSDSFVDLWAQGGSIDIGNVNSASSTSLVADTFIQGGNIVAGGSIFAQAGGNIDLGALTSNFGSIFLDAGGNLDLSGNASADGDIELLADGTIDIQNAVAGESVVLDAGGNVHALNLTAGDNVDVGAGGSVNVGNLSAGLVNPSTSEGASHNVKVVAGGNILTGDIEAGQHIGLATPGAMTGGDINAGGVFMALGHGDMIFGDATASEVFLSDFGILNPGGLTATCVGSCGTTGVDGVVTAPPNGPTYSYVTTDGGVDGAGQLSVGGTNGSLYTTSAFDVAAGDTLDFFFNYVTSDGSSFADYAWAALLTPSLDPVAILYTARTQPSGTIVPGFGLPGVEATLDPEAVPIIGGGPAWSPLGPDSGACFAAGCGYTGWVSSSYQISEAGSYVLRFGVTNFLDTGFQSGMAFSGLSIGGVSVAPVLLTPTGGSITIGDVNTGKFSAAAGTSLTTGIIDSGGAISLDAGGAITTGNLSAGDFVLANGGSITTGHIDAGSVDMTSTGGDISTGDIFAFGSVALAAFGDISSGDITGGSIDLLAGDDISTGDLTTQVPLLLAAQEDPGPFFLIPGASITLESGGDITTGDIASIDGVFADAGGSLSTGAINAFDFVQLLAGSNINTGAVNAGTFMDISSSNGGITTLALTASDGDIDLDAAGNIVFGNANAGGEFDFSAGGAVTGGNVVAGNEIGGDAGGTVTLGNLTAGASLDSDFSVGIAAVGNVTVGNVSGAGQVGFATQGNLATGDLSAGDLVMTLVGGNTTTGSITTTGESGQVYMADDSMFITGGGTIDGEGDFDENIVLALQPVATGGSITINGPVSTGLFRAAAGTGLTTQAITAGDIRASAGGTATINGIWNSSNEVQLSSNDIEISASGGINAGGYITLVSTNATQALIGDGLSGSGYALSNAEFGRISGEQVRIVGRGDASAAIDMLVGNLTVTGPLVGSNVEGSEGALVFAVGNVETLTPSGVIRVVGNVNATGFGSANAIEFYATRFELDAATGSVSILSSGSTLGGELGIYADRIHVASTSILDQLATNPTYTNYRQDLINPATVQRPEGVLRADTLWIESNNLQSILIQNTGTAAAPAGFLVRQAFVNEDFDVAGPPGSINLVVNGQVVTDGGTLTGIAARDALITSETDITPFTSDSRINGCPLTGACIPLPPPPPPTGNVVDNFIDLLGNDPLGDSDFGNEEDIDDNEEGNEGADNPINPPQPLFDTRPLIPGGEVDDPVSGTGNPALLGSDQQCEEDESAQCTAQPAEGENQ